ncbi:MAG: 1,6-anhydro-N-acetylmuramyl-L-alanine amidase AmpD [Pseudomonadota bacterium]
MSETIFIDGWHSRARHCESPNANERPEHCVPELIVVHNISLPPGKFGTGDIEALFCNRLDFSADPFFDELVGLEVSSHFLIDRAGALVQFVSADRRAWHAGRSSYGGRAECNDFSIGIELEGTDTLRYTDEQYKSLAHLITALRIHYPNLAGGGIAGHSDIAPGRKTDPGPAFDWARLRRMLAGSRHDASLGP